MAQVAWSQAGTLGRRRCGARGTCFIGRAAESRRGRRALAVGNGGRHAARHAVRLADEQFGLTLTTLTAPVAPTCNVRPMTGSITPSQSRAWLPRNTMPVLAGRVHWPESS